MKIRLLNLAKGCGYSRNARKNGNIAVMFFGASFLHFTPLISVGYDYARDQAYGNMLQRESIKEFNEFLKDPRGVRARPEDNPRFAECDRAHVECTAHICGNLTGERMNHFNECFADCNAKREACLSGSSTQSSIPSSTNNSKSPANSVESLAMQGDPNAQVKLGERARAMKNETMATQWFTLAATNGHPKAQLFLAFRYFFGVGAPKNPAMADFWLRKAATQGEPMAQEMMRQVTESGVRK